jgi:glycosyltransferase involved in cell wall biosynthesis
MHMLFIRDFHGFTGGHLKVLHYLRHTATTGFVHPVLYQTPRSRSVAGNIFSQYEGPKIDELQKFPAYFLAGEDWFTLDHAGIELGSSYVINLIQGFRHADPNHPLFSCLKRPALRICVSHAVADAIRDHANGQVVVIENGTEVQKAPITPISPRRVLIAGWKNQTIAREISTRIERFSDVDLMVDFVTRDVFLSKITQAAISIMLPLPKEGFFLPALEAMALGRAVITTNCGGNLTFCKSEVNCLVTEYQAYSVADAARRLVEDRPLWNRLVSGGLSTAAQLSIDAERTKYQKLLAHFMRASA